MQGGFRILVILFMLSMPGIAQEFSLVFFPQGYIPAATQSVGFSSLTRVPIEDIGTANPATIIHWKNPSGGIGWMMRSKIQDAILGDESIYQEKIILPEKIAFATGFKRVALALSYAQNYNSRVELRIPLTTVEDGGQYYATLRHKTRIQSVNIGVGLKSRNMVQNRYWGIGTTIHVRNVRYNEKMSEGLKLKGEANIYAVNYSVGFMVSMNKYFRLGASFEKGLNTKGDFKLDDQAILVTDSTTTYFDQHRVYSIKAKSPDKYNFGMDFIPDDRFRISTTITYVKWKSLAENYLSSLDFSQNFIIKLGKSVRGSIGILKTDRRQKENFIFENSYRTIFVSLGYERIMWGNQIRFIIMDSHLFSDKGNKTTLLRLAWAISK